MQPPHTEESQVRLRRGEAAAANAPHTSTKQQNKKQQAIGRCYGAANLPQSCQTTTFWNENLNATQ